MADYRPVACGFYDRFEIAIMHRQRLLTRWRDPGGDEREALLRPRDLRIRDSAEYLLAEDATGATLALRLDRILSARPVEGP